MRIEQFDPASDGRRLQALYGTLHAASARDDPGGPSVSLGDPRLLTMPVRGLQQGGRSFVGSWSQGLDGHPQQTWLATDAGGEPIGACVLELPDRDDTGVAFCCVVVPPDQRGHGIGRTLLAHSAGHAERAGRSMLVGESRDASAGAGFAAAVGARRGGTTDQRRVLDVDANLPGRLADLPVLAERRASGYSLQSWTGVAAELDVDQLAAVIEAIADAPRPGSMKAEQWDAARVRADETRTLALGLTVHSMAARHDQSGELAALTQVCIDPLLPGWAFQLLTVVARSHRGHRLGLLVKVAMHRLLVEQRPDVRRIMTTNEASNQPMIGINEQLGYRITDTFASWELPVAEALVAAT